MFWRRHPSWSYRGEQNIDCFDKNQTGTTLGDADSLSIALFTFLKSLYFSHIWLRNAIQPRQIVKPSATLLSINSIGDKYPKHLRGLLLIKETTDSNCS